MLIGIDASRAFIAERTGTENYANALITHMLRLPAAKKHDFVLFTRPNAIVPKEISGYNNVVVKPINWRILWTQLGLARETWVSKLDVLWIPAHTLPILRKKGIKTVVTIHGLEYKYLPEYNNWLQRWYLPLSTYYAALAADRLICVSESTKRDLIAETQIDAKKISVIWEGVEKNPKIDVTKAEKEKLWERLGIKNQQYILFVGTMQPRKNVGALIKAFRLIYRDYPEFRLVLAGKVGWRVKEELALSARLGIAEAVVWTGRVEQAELSALYQGATVYVQPSHTEGFGLPILEAMRAGVSVVSSSGGALPEVVGEGGVIVALGAEFEAKLANAVRQLLADPNKRLQLRRAAKKRVEALTWERAAAATLNTLLL